MASMFKMDVTIDDGGLKAAFAVAPKNVRDKGGAAVRKISLLGEGIIRRDMPVDTGRARASWGHWTPGELKDAAKAVEKGANEADAIWEETQEGINTQITQGSNVEYIQALNEGHSQQMGAGFIDDTAQSMAYWLIRELEKVLDGIWS